MVKTSRHLEEWASPRTVITLTMLFVVVLWAAVGFWVVSARHERMLTTSESLQRMNHAVEDQTRRQFRLVNVFLAACANWLEANPNRDPRSAPAFQRLIRGFRDRTGEAIDIRLLAADGGLFDVEAAATDPLANVADSDYFKNTPASGQLFIGSPTRARLEGHSELPVALRLSTSEHAFPILVAAIDLGKLTAVYEKQRRKPGGVITLLRSDGMILARAPDAPQLLGQPISGAALPANALALQPGDALPEPAAGGERRQITSYSPVPDFPLLVMVSADYDDVLEPWLRQSLWVILLAVGVTVPLAVVAFRSLQLLRALASRDAALQHLATTDRLTGVSSRQHFVATLEEQLQRANREQMPLSVLLFDIDFFKRINDGYGHAVGDQALIAFAEVASDCLREMDLIGRLGAGDFAMLLPATRIDEAIGIAERVRAAIANVSIVTENGTVQFTVSVGASEASASDSSFDSVLKRATAALQGARSGGPDHVLVI